MDNVVERAKERCDKGDIDKEYVMLLAREVAKVRKQQGKLIKDMLVRKNEMTDWFNEKIQNLHELAFTLIEEKQNEANLVPIEEYERLLNWSIEMMQGLRDDL